MRAPTFTVDWVAYTVPVLASLNNHNSNDWYELRARHVTDVAQHFTPTKPRLGYTLSWTLSPGPGPVVHMLPADGGRHAHVVWAGSALAAFDNTHDPLSFALQQEYPVRRLDVAFDVFTGDIDSIWQAWQAGEVQTPFKRHQHVTSDTGQTLYLGSRSSDRFLRIYDKAGETGTPGPWIRFELELKGEQAERIAKHLGSEGYHSIPGLIRSVITCPTLPWVTAAFDKHASHWAKPQPENTPDTAAWMLGQVRAAIMNLYRKDPANFKHAWQELYRRVGEGTGFYPDPFDGAGDFD